VQPDGYGYTNMHETSSAMWSHGGVAAAGSSTIIQGRNLPAAAIINPVMYASRGHDDRVFSAGDEVTVTLDCTNCTLRVRSPTVDYTIDVMKGRRQWVLNVNCSEGEYQVQLLP